MNATESGIIERSRGQKPDFLFYFKIYHSTRCICDIYG
jgi:hypothetical protein